MRIDKINRKTGERKTAFEGKITAAKIIEAEKVETRQDKILIEMIRLVFRAVWFSETKLIFIVLSVLQDHNNDETAFGSKEAIKSLKRAIDGLDKTLTRCRDVYTKKAKG